MYRTVYVKTLEEFLSAVSSSKKALVGGENCSECLALLLLVERCIDTYIELSIDIDEKLIEYLFSRGVYGVPFAVINKEIIYSDNLEDLRRALCG